MNRLTTKERLLAAVAALLVGTLAAVLAGFAGVTAADESAAKNLERRLLGTSQGIQYPGSESDSTWRFVSYPDEEELPDAARLQEISGCPVTEEGGTVSFDFDSTIGRLSRVEPWMDEGQVRSAKGFGKLGRVFECEYAEQAVYRCETGEYGQVYIYFVGSGDAGVSGLLTVSTET